MSRFISINVFGRIISPLYILSATLLWFASPILRATGGPNAPIIGKSPPPLRLSRVLQGPAAVEISWDKLKGQVVVLEFWGTQCAPCVAAIPHWNQLAVEFAGRPVVFLSISDENADHVSAFLKRKPMQGWVALDGPLAATQTAFDVQGIPHTVIVNKEGVIAAITHPRHLEARHLEEVLAGKPCSLPVTQPAAESNGDNTELLSKLAANAHKITDASISGPFPQPDGPFGLRGWKLKGTRFEAQKASVKDIVAGFFQISPLLVKEEAALPEGLYDVTMSGPEGRERQLQNQFTAALNTAFGLHVQTNRRTVDVYVMTSISTNVPNRQQVTTSGGGGQRPGGFSLRGNGMRSISSLFEASLGQPVIDETHDTNRWAVEINWQMSPGEKWLPQAARKLSRATLMKLDQVSPTLTPAELLPLDSDELAVLKAELLKPPGRRFQPEPAHVIAAAREQLGLELKPSPQTLTVVEITSEK